MVWYVHILVSTYTHIFCICVYICRSMLSLLSLFFFLLEMTEIFLTVFCRSQSQVLHCCDHVVIHGACSFFSSQCQSLSTMVMKGSVCCLRPWKWMRYQGQSFPTHVLRPVKLWKANCILPYGRVLACSSVGAQETILSALQNGSLVLFNSLNH